VKDLDQTEVDRSTTLPVIITLRSTGDIIYPDCIYDIDFHRRTLTWWDGQISRTVPPSPEFELTPFEDLSFQIVLPDWSFAHYWTDAEEFYRESAENGGEINGSS
jgi:hypothetical protein